MDNEKCIKSLPAIHVHEKDLKRTQGLQTRDKFMELSTDSKICLLSFAVFPDNQEVNKMMLIIGVL